MIITSKSLKYYLENIKKFPHFTQEQERECLLRICNGDASGEEELIKANLRFVVAVARNYGWSGLAMEDLINAGNLGLVAAVKRIKNHFRMDKGHRFNTYAIWWIRAEIFKEIYSQRHIVNIPPDKQQEVRHFKKTLDKKVSNKNGKPLTQSQLNEFGTSFEMLQAIQAMGPYISMDASLANSEQSLQDILANQSVPTSDILIENLDASNHLEAALNKLTADQQKLVNYVYGLHHQTYLGLDGAAKHLGITKEKARQQIELIKRQLRSMLIKQTKETD